MNKVDYRQHRIFDIYSKCITFNVGGNRPIFDDMLDVNFDISLYEYGLIRDSKTGFTILGMNYDENKNIFIDFKWTYIEEEDILDYIEDVSDLDEFLSYIDCSIEQVYLDIEEGRLAGLIRSINDWNGWFNN